MLAILGPKRRDKGTIGRILRAMLGDNNVTSPTMALLASNFGLAPAIGKMAMIVPDARASGKDGQVIVERFLMITGEDSITVDRKNREAWTGQLGTRIVLMSNELPSLGDSSGALNGRMIYLHAAQTFYGREDVGLTKRLMAELPGIFNWALEGLARLQQRGKFLQPEAGMELAYEMEALNNPMKAFLERCCVLGEEESVRKDYLFAAWKGYCRKHERNVGSAEVFSKMLFASQGSVKSKRTWSGGERQYEYNWITLRPDLLEHIATTTFGGGTDDRY
jgi:P4 family phage/plasmid primase-like protien